MLQATTLGLFIVLVLVIVYQYYKISEGFINTNSIIEIKLKPNDKYIDIVGKTLDGSTRLVSILYSSSTPVLSVGNRTDSSLVVNRQVTPTASIIQNIEKDQLKRGHTYYVVPVNNIPYTAGTNTPLLGSFTYEVLDNNSDSRSDPIQKSNKANQNSGYGTEERPIAFSAEATIAKEKQDKASLMRDIQELVRKEVLQQQQLTTASSQPILRTGADSKIMMSPATAQGQELSTSREKLCPKDMNEYIRKDSIPCWNCTLDY